MVFPVIHSTLDPKALIQELEQRYDLQDNVRCQLISRANNDFYEVISGKKRFALRVAKANFRNTEESLFEAEYVTHLKQAGCLVPAPIKTQDGRYFFEVEAPEGLRTITLMDWLDGKPFCKGISPEEANHMGSALAALHDAGESFESQASRSIDTVEILKDRMPDLYLLLDHEPEHRLFYERAAATVETAFQQLDSAALRRGAVHGDFQFANAMRTPNGSIAVIDFDTCGVGYCAEDLYTFVWRSDMEIRDTAVNQAFFSGYESVRPLNDEERQHGPLFRLARDLVMSSSFAILINRIGPVPGFDGDFQPFTDLARRHLVEANLA